MNTMVSKDIKEKRFYCSTHDKCFRDRYALTVHMNGGKHIHRPKKEYYCEVCNYRPTFATNYFKHLKTKKHKRNSK